MKQKTNYYFLGIIFIIALFCYFTVHNIASRNNKSYDTNISYVSEATTTSTQTNLPSINKLSLSGLPFEKATDTSDVKVTLKYNNPPEGYSPDDKFTKDGVFIVSKEKNKENLYGNEFTSILKAQDSHSYQGAAVNILNDAHKYTLKHIGLQINDRSFISRLKVELGVDYMVREDELENNSVSKTFFQRTLGLFKTMIAEACGPGIFLREVGNSDLIFISEKNSVSWFNVDKPINLYNLPKSYCDPTKPVIEIDPETGKEYIDDTYCLEPLKDFKDGNLRMHVMYLPNNKEGLLEVKVSALILEDEKGNYVTVPLSNPDQLGKPYHAYLQ